jgi:hypothetical protein
MSWRPPEGQKVTATIFPSGGQWRYQCGPYRSINYLSKDAARAAIADRFKSAEIVEVDEDPLYARK